MIHSSFLGPAQLHGSRSSYMDQAGPGLKNKKNQNIKKIYLKYYNKKITTPYMLCDRKYHT
jgi:hypothetical protein